MLDRFVDYSKELINTYFYGDITRKEKLYDVFGEISDTLLQASLDLEINKFPYESCKTMKELTGIVIKQTEYSKNDKRIIKLYNMLNDCNDLKRRYDKNETPNIICDLRKASSEFKALSMAVMI